MTENSKPAALLRWLPPIFGALYKLALLAALAWIGLGLQDIADALYSGNEACVVDPEANDGGEDAQPGIIKPLLRG